MTFEYVFTPEQQRLLDHIEETRKACIRPLEEAVLKLYDYIGEISISRRNIEERRRERMGRPPLDEFCRWDYCSPHRRQQFDQLMMGICTLNNKYAEMTAKIYAVVPVSIGMTLEEFRKSTLYKGEDDGNIN